MMMTMMPVFDDDSDDDDDKNYNHIDNETALIDEQINQSCTKVNI